MDNQLTLFQIAARYTNTSQAVIQQHYNLLHDIANFINTTSYDHIAICMDLKSNESLEFIFNNIKYAESAHKDAIVQFLSRHNATGNVHARSFLQLISNNYSTSFIDYCTSYPKLLSTIGYDKFLIHITTENINITSAELKSSAEKLSVTTSGNKTIYLETLVVASSVSQWTGRNRTEAASALKYFIDQYYAVISVNGVSRKFNKSMETVKNTAMIDIASMYANVSSTFLKGIFQLSQFSDMVTNVLSELTLTNLTTALNDDSLVSKPINILIYLITFAGEYATMAGRKPMLLSLYHKGITGLRVPLNETLMELFIKSSNLSEQFLISWFDMNSDMISVMKDDKLSKLFLKYFPSMQPVQLQCLPILHLAERSSVLGYRVRLVLFFH